MSDHNEPLIEAIYHDDELFDQRICDTPEKQDFHHLMLDTHNNYRTIYRYQTSEPITVVPIQKPTKRQQKQGIKLHGNSYAIKISDINASYQNILRSIHDNDMSKIQKSRLQTYTCADDQSFQQPTDAPKLEELTNPEPKVSTQESSFLISSETAQVREQLLHDLSLSDLSDAEFQENEYGGPETDEPPTKLSLANWREVAMSHLLNAKTKWRDMWGKPAHNLSFDVQEKTNENNIKILNSSLRKVQSAGLYGKTNRTSSKANNDGLQTLHERHAICAENIVDLLNRIPEQRHSKTPQRYCSSSVGQISIWKKCGTGKSYDPYLNEPKAQYSGTPSFFKAKEKDSEDFKQLCAETKQRRMQSCKERLVVQPQSEMAKVQMRRFMRKCHLCGRKITLGFQSSQQISKGDYVCVGCGQYVEAIQ